MKHQIQRISVVQGKGGMMMIDCEKVIKGLNCCSGSDPCANNCPYYDNCGKNYSCTSNLAKDALALLKEQETVEPEIYYVGPDKHKFYRCPVCKMTWYYKGKYCLECGRLVKWDE